MENLEQVFKSSLEILRSKFSAETPRTGPMTRIRVWLINKGSVPRETQEERGPKEQCLSAHKRSPWTTDSHPGHDKTPGLCSSAPTAVQELDKASKKLPTLPAPGRESKVPPRAQYHRESRVRWTAPWLFGWTQIFRADNVPVCG